ncbi:PARP polymerase [Bacillus phage YungSlug]|nr:PARP polymerase [Bacillus phage YungSlug]
MTRAGLMPVQRMVTRDGKTFQTTVWVKTKHANKVDKNKNIDIPKWDFKTHEEFKTEKERINKIDDRSERQVLKEALLSHVKDTMKVSWDVVPDTEDKAFARNFMRASSAAMKHLKANPKPAQPKVVVPTKASAQATATNNALAKPIGTTNIMSRDDSKAKAKEIRDKVGIDKLMDTMDKAGIKWDKTSEVGPNRMRALRAFAKFTRQGGELNFDGKATVTVSDAKKDKLQPKPAPAKKDTPPSAPVSKFKPGTIEHTYEQATPHQKLIGVLTGILPENPKIAEYLDGLVKGGQIDITASGELEAIKLPKKLTEDFNYYFGNDADFSAGDYGGGLKSANVTSVIHNQNLAGIFDGDSHAQRAFEDYKEHTEAFVKKHGQGALIAGFENAKTMQKLFEAFYAVGNNWPNMSGLAVITSLGDKIKSGDADEWYDKLGFNDPNPGDGDKSTLGNIITYSMNYYGTYSFFSVAQKKLPQAWLAKQPSYQVADMGILQTAVKNGELTKKEVLDAISSVMTDKAFLTQNSRANTTKTVAESMKESRLFRRKNEKLLEGLGSPKTGIAILNEANELVKDYAYFKTQDAMYLSMNIAMYNFCQRANQAPATYKAIPRSLYESGHAPTQIAKVHLTALKARSDKSREKVYSSVKPDPSAKIKNQYLMGKIDADKMEFPDPADAKSFLKSSLAPVEDGEAKTIEKKINDTHDRRNHGSFTTKVNGVYRIKDIAVEEKFQEINAKINTTGFYYHGTSFNSAQKIIGLTGGFKVFTDSANIKAGSMLGYGIYLATESSKSMQYVGNGFRQGGKGVLFLCKASLGQVTPSSVRGFDHNQKLMNQSNTDTVFMDRPHVINPEWAVKRAEQAVPRLWIDVERVSK